MPKSGEDGLADENYGEKLPDQCPPDHALDEALTDVYRLVRTDKPDQSCFASRFALGEIKPEEYKATDCEWASCSLFASVDAMLKIKGLRRRNKFVAKLQIPENSGRHVVDKKTHIHFWRFSAFDLSNAVESVWEHGLS
jgi:hypothetical protein